MRKNRHRRPRSGFTLLELLAVMVIVGMVLALLLPAIGAAREAARRSRCQSNLRQIGQAFQEHIAATGMLPPSRTVVPVHSGWSIYLLPFLEQTELNETYHFDKDFCDAANEPVLRTRLPVFECPTNPEPGRMIPVARLGQNPTGIQGAAGDYYVNHLLNNMGLPAGMARRPALLIGEFQRPAAIVDGLSNTTLLQEQAGRPAYYVQGRRVTDKVIANAAWGAWGSYQHFHFQGYASDGFSIGWDCAINCNNGLGIYSFHPGGTNTAFCDGSVRVLRESIDVRIVFAIGTRDGGEVIDVIWNTP